MFSWAVRARLPSDSTPFFSYPQDKWKLSAEDMNTSIKATFKLFGFDENLGKTHSLRIGGASALAAAGVNDSIIMILGRWKSLAFLLYIRLSTSIFNRAVDVMCSGTLSADDVRRMSAGATLY